MKTGRDVVIAALLGAEEYGFATAPLVVSGCIMMRVCHLDTCPVGIATQNPELRKRFTGKPEFVETSSSTSPKRSASDGRARLPHDGRDDRPRRDARHPPAIEHWKASGPRHQPDPRRAAEPVRADDDPEKSAGPRPRRGARPAADRARAAGDRGRPARPIDLPIRNVNRTVGTLLGHEVTKRWKGAGLPDGTIDITFTGSAGQSFGAFVPPGQIRLVGDANDYVGKGLSGGRIIVHPHPFATFVAEEKIIAGNVIAYGATGGEIFLRGIVGERFCVRNSGAVAVVEGVGDHGCEYMTGGRVVVLGPTGRNFGAGMSGGIAYVYDPTAVFAAKVNYEMVELEPLDDDRRQFLRDTVARHRDETGSAVAERMLADWDADVDAFRKVMPKDYKRVLTVIAEARPPASTRPDRRRSWRQSWRLSEGGDVTDEGFLKWDRETPQTAAGAGAGQATGRRSTRTFPMETLLKHQAGRCMDCGIPFCNNGCPLGNLIPDWNDLVYRDHWRTRSSGCTPPTTSPSSPGGCARRRASRRACSASTRTR
jgi:glutamate synthase (NADPH/NADH) large chain